MKKNYIYKSVLFILIWFYATGQTTTNLKAPNILCILVDDLGYGDLSIQGATDMQTPNIDNIARQGITFTNFYANSTVCSPSRAALLSGKYPEMVGVPGVIRQVSKDSWGNLTDNSLLISEVLKNKGYQTAIIGKWHLGLGNPDTPNDKGFDHFKGFLGDMMDDYWTHRRGGINWMRYNEKEIDPKGHATDIFTNWAIDYLNEHKENRAPFFMYLAYNAPHFPIQPPKEWLEKVIAREPNISEKRAKNVAFIEHLDFNIGRVMQSLKETGLDDNTLVVFTSDNGGALWYAQSNGKLRGGKQDMYEGGIRVPTYFYWKNKIAPNTKTSNFAMLMDLFPTFCDVAGIQTSKNVDGISILPILLGRVQKTDNRYVYWVRREGGKYGGQAYYAARYKDFKIVQNTPYEPIQLFNLKNDEYETQPLNTSGVEVYNELRSQLQDHIRKTGRVPWQ
ncbi:sulfatase family protein [Snuella sedimenti]|uniref:Sulfatase-like hydrolase/transferase n=1 Tax=Snuella sedimenti TaxID=2798802 RepID=A0A8J7LSS1_9FLAO|nr:sulfatase-like hydrolase/transferase [Snuella sedimenti]MBJ6368730.1 sulfatase-like hydrolase/transferase [Snuella sedimenti]